MKIGIFGDSFADCNGCKERWNTPGWSDFIKDNYDIKAGAGLSEVTSYASPVLQHGFPEIFS